MKRVIMAFSLSVVTLTMKLGCWIMVTCFSFCMANVIQAAEMPQAEAVRIAILTIKPDCLDAFTAAVKEEMRDALAREPGVIAIYAVADKTEPTKITFFEMYINEEAYELHRNTPHFLKYFNTTKDMISERVLMSAVPLELRDKYNTPLE